MRITDDNLHGRVVLSSDGIAIGEVTKLFFQGAQFGIEGIEVKLRKESAERLGIDRSVFHPATLEIPIALIQSVGDAVLLSAPLEQLRGLRTSANTRRERSQEHEPGRAPART